MSAKPPSPKSKRGRGVLRKDGKPRESNTGTRKPVVDDSNWRVKAKGKHRIKFDDKAKHRYLKELAATGRKWSAEQAAGVVRSTVDAHLENDPDFAKAFDDALEAYATPRLIRIETDIIEGHQENTYGPDGQLVKEKRNFESGLRAMFLKKHDKAYEEHSHVELGAKAGCVIIPGVAPLADWEKAVAEHDRAQKANHAPESDSE